GHPASPDALAVAEQQKVTVIPARGRITVNFGVERPLRFREKGLHVLQVKFLEPDQLPADDSRTLAFPVRDSLRVLIVDGKPDPMPSRRGGTSLRRALLPDEASAAFTPARPQVITPDEFLNPVADYLSNVDCIYLCDVPAPGAELAAKLDRFLKRGGAVVVGLGPSSAGPASRAEYNRYFFNEGNGILPSPLGEIVTVANPDDPGFRLYAEEEDYRRAPLKLFLDEKVRGGLIMAPFKSYVRLEPPPQKSPPVTPSPEIAPEGAARRVLSFSSGSQTGVHRRDDPAVVEWTRHRGRVILFTSSFNEDWNDWPPLPSYLMFQQELLRFAAANPDRHTLRVGDAIEEFYPAKFAGATATITGPGSLNTSVSLSMHEEGAFASFRETALSGLYRIRVSDQPDRVFAVNVPESAAGSNGGTGSESDLKQLELSELKPLGSPQIVTEVGDVKPTPQSGAEITSAPKPHGPAIARFAVLLALAILALEMFISWRWGPSRAAGAGTATGSARPVERRPFLRVLSTLGALIPLAAAAFIIATLIHYESTGELLGFLPPAIQEDIQRAAGVPQAQPGEGTKWRLER
ncbi:MAG TPA: hypothetical protein VLM40_12650, partial [Gemmata sp.]|nr:hypothetical protein [Gemmata sp.]